MANNVLEKETKQNNTRNKKRKFYNKNTSKDQKLKEKLDATQSAVSALASTASLFLDDVPETVEAPESETKKQTQKKKSKKNNTNKTDNKDALKVQNITPEITVTLAEPKKKAQNNVKKRPQNKPVKNEPKTQKAQNKAVNKPPVKIIPLGGLNEIGKNLTVIECDNDAIIIDCGLAFPDSEMPGVDIVIPDFSYLEKIVDKIKGVVLTHGHEDHIGGLPYLLKKFDIPVYGTRLTMGLVEGKLREQGILSKAKLHVVAPKETVNFGCLSVEFIRVNHSIPDAVGLGIKTPVGVIIHTGDFKVDYTPIEGGIIDLGRFSSYGENGVLALMSDSTNAERPGFTPTERKVGESFGKLFTRAEGRRIIIATFSSNIHRVQQIIDNAFNYGRKVAIFGRSMQNVIGKAIELGYLDIPENTMIDIDMMNRYPAEEMVIITTGSQGEPMSALTRMALNDHRQVSITPNDFIIISATPIPGNEKHVTKVVNELMKSGAEVVYEAMYDVHVSGHACQEELKLMLSLTKPKFFIPVHGEYKHLQKHKEIALEVGINPDNIIIGDIGNVIETDGKTMKITSSVPSGKVLVDGLGVGDVGDIVLRDRKHLAQDGLIVVVTTLDGATGDILAEPEIVSRGFVYVKESEELMGEARAVLKETLENCISNGFRDHNSIKTKLKDSLSDYIYRKTKRSPMILPIIMTV